MQASDWFTVGVMAPSQELALNSLRALETVGAGRRWSCAEAESDGPVFLKANQKENGADQTRDRPGGRGAGERPQCRPFPLQPDLGTLPADVLLNPQPRHGSTGPACRDMGGTKTLLALYSLEDDGLHLRHRQRFESAAWSSLEPMLATSCSSGPGRSLPQPWLHGRRGSSARALGSDHQPALAIAGGRGGPGGRGRAVGAGE